MKSKTIIIVVLILAILGGGGFFFLSSNKSSQKPKKQEPLIQEENLPSLSPEEIGLKTQVRDDKKAIKFEVANVKDITAIDYEISYLAKGEIPRGVIGHVEKNSGESSMSTKYIELGSCSSGKCKYDEGVTDLKLILKITKDDGKTYQAEQKIDL
ncbi:MAG: hypothetical protein M1450_03830 [Patescibacteria group bacterium]|nr:hypothetical protein [Patescibacteria group bacterium]